jgi:hypothetical protein
MHAIEDVVASRRAVKLEWNYLIVDGVRITIENTALPFESLRILYEKGLLIMAISTISAIKF